ncbi:MAG: hypothetical protein IJK61_05870, partial [Bacteroidetes bacterium]|nr:hypothetical protein [Bacteroidota bacterium]
MKLLIKKLFIVLIMLIAGINISNSLYADTLTLGSAQTTSYGYLIPYYYYGYDIYEFIVTRAELGNKGSMYLKEMDFYVASAYNSTTYPGNTSYTNIAHNNYKIYIKHTTATSLTTPATSSFYPTKDYSDYQLVYERNNRFAGFTSGQWDTLVFDRDFIYNGEDNIQICIVGTRTINYGTPYCELYYYTFSSSANMAYYGYAYTGYSGYAYAMQYRPYTRFIYDQGPEIREIYPSNNYSFLAGALYSQAEPRDRNEIPGFKVFVGNLPNSYPAMKATFTITGPDGSDSIVYRGLDPSTSSNYITFRKSDMDPSDS